MIPKISYFAPKLVEFHPQGFCNTENPCNFCLAIPKHKYVGKMDRDDCKVCGFSGDMPCHEVSK